MQTTFSETQFMRATGLLSAASLLTLVALLSAGCSTKYQQAGYVSGYYPSHGGSSASKQRNYERYSTVEPTHVSGAAAMHRATLRAYTVFGKRYYPQIVAPGTQEQGIASWYGPDFHGKQTSNGETYNMYAPGTAAHKTLPMNTIVLVTHRETGQQVKVRINDRGPFVQGRIIDLSYTAGKALGLDKTGIAPVTLQVVEYDPYITAQLNGQGIEPVRVAQTTPVPKQPENTVIPIAEASVTSQGTYAVQLGSFKSSEGAARVKSAAKDRVQDRSVVIKTVEFGPEKLHRVLIGGFGSKEEAQRFIDEQGFKSAVVVAAS